MLSAIVFSEEEMIRGLWFWIIVSAIGVAAMAATVWIAWRMWRKDRRREKWGRKYAVPSITEGKTRGGGVKAPPSSPKPPITPKPQKREQRNP